MTKSYFYKENGFELHDDVKFTKSFTSNYLNLNLISALDHPTPALYFMLEHKMMSLSK